VRPVPAGMAPIRSYDHKTTDKALTPPCYAHDSTGPMPTAMPISNPDINHTGHTTSGACRADGCVSPLTICKSPPDRRQCSPHRDWPFRFVDAMRCCPRGPGSRELISRSNQRHGVGVKVEQPAHAPPMDPGKNLSQQRPPRATAPRSRAAGDAVCRGNPQQLTSPCNLRPHGASSRHAACTMCIVAGGLPVPGQWARHVPSTSPCGVTPG
jgi:hypothetical protein